MRQISWAVPIVLLLAACNGGGETGETDVVEETGGETGDTEVPFTGLEVTVNAPVGADTTGLAAAAFLFHIDDAVDFGILPAHESDSVSFGTASSVVLQIPELASEDIGPLFDDYQGGMWVVYVYEDADGNATQGVNERVVGVSSHVVVYATTADTAATDIVIPANEWSAIEVAGPENIVIGDSTEPFPIDRVLQRDAITAGGSIDNTVETLPNLRVTTLSGVDRPSGAPPLDEAITGTTWEVTLDTPLNANRTDPIDPNFDLQVGIEIPFAYTDDDTSGDYLDSADTLRAAACFDDAPVGFMFVQDIVTPTDAVLMMVMGLNPGWNAMLLESVDGFTFLADADLDALDLSSTCPFPN